MTPRRRMIPFAIVGILALLTFGIAVVGVHEGPSPDQMSLQMAAEQTADAGSFSYTLSGETAATKEQLR